MTSARGQSLLDGLQIRISEKYRPPRRVTLPPDYVNRLQQDIEAILDLDYDFKLEEQILATYPHTPSPTHDERPKETDGVSGGSSGNGDARSSPVSGTSSSGITKPARPPPPLSHGHGSTSSANNPVLLNPAFASVSYRPLEPKKAPAIPNPSSAPNSAANNGFRVEDFEQSSSDPFDNMELKSLNDMEELQRVLGKDPR